MIRPALKINQICIKLSDVAKRQQYRGEMHRGNFLEAQNHACTIFESEVVQVNFFQFEDQFFERKLTIFAVNI